MDPLPALGVADASAHHLLVVPDGVPPADVEALVLSWFPESSARATAQQILLEPLPGCAVDGPWAAAGLELPDWARAVYRLRAPRQRGDAVPAELQGRGDLLDAFADGEPLAQERTLLELGLAAARRLGGAVRAAGTDGALLTPDPRADLVVYSPVWLHPDALTHVLEPALPGIAAPVPVTPSTLPPDAVTGSSLVGDEGERRWLHAEAEAYDAAALSQPEVTESYGVVTTIDSSIFSVTVEAAVGVPVVLSSTELSGLIVYELRCYADGRPSPESVARLDAATAALLTAVGGHVVDDDGFLVDLGTA